LGDCGELPDGLEEFGEADGLARLSRNISLVNWMPRARRADVFRAPHAARAHRLRHEVGPAGRWARLGWSGPVAVGFVGLITSV